jgi:hypothetical protein
MPENVLSYCVAYLLDVLPTDAHLDITDFLSEPQRFHSKSQGSPCRKQLAEEQQRIKTPAL